MTCSSLLVYVDPSPAGIARLETACDLAKAFDAHLIGVSASMPPPPMVDPLAVGAEMLAAYREVAAEEVRHARETFETAVQARSVRSEWRGGVDWPADLVTRAARAADLVILGPRTTAAPYRSPDPASVLQAIGRPVLLVPDTLARPPLDNPAVVGWKDTRESQRAVVASLPLLRRAKAVSVIEVAAAGGQEDDAGVADVRDFLGRHGVDATAQVLARGEQTTSSRILSHAESLEAGLIVIGGYGRPRLQQWILGGVTRTMLQHSPVCILLAH
ncbi:MAG: universal stress protein [Brevundimonas sp.]|nr:universal stress protein [Brevundimonas sp.]